MMKRALFWMVTRLRHSGQRDELEWLRANNALANNVATQAHRLLVPHGDEEDARASLRQALMDWWEHEPRKVQ